MACATVRRLVIGVALVRIMPAPRFNLAIQRSQTNRAKVLFAHQAAGADQSPSRWSESMHAA